MIQIATRRTRKLTKLTIVVVHMIWRFWTVKIKEIGSHMHLQAKLFLYAVCGNWIWSLASRSSTLIFILYDVLLASCTFNIKFWMH